MISIVKVFNAAHRFFFFCLTVCLDFFSLWLPKPVSNDVNEIVLVELALEPTGKEIFKFIQNSNRFAYVRANMIYADA